MTNKFMADNDLKGVVLQSPLDDLNSFLDHYNVQLLESKEYSDSDPSVSVIAPHSNLEEVHVNFLNQLSNQSKLF
jgi:hypothetical protein